MIAPINLPSFLISSMVSGMVSTADLLLVVSDRIARAFNRSGINQAVSLDISKAIGYLLGFQVGYLPYFL